MAGTVLVCGGHRTVIGNPVFRKVHIASGNLQTLKIRSELRYCRYDAVLASGQPLQLAVNKCGGDRL